jgi:hypothetical protein
LPILALFLIFFALTAIVDFSVCVSDLLPDWALSQLEVP